MSNTDTPTPATPPCRLTTNDAAAFCGLAPSTLRYWRHAGVGPASYTIGTRVLYDLPDLAEWVAAQKAASLRGGVK